MYMNTYIYIYIFTIGELVFINMFVGTLSVPICQTSQTATSPLFLLGAARMSREVQAHFLEGPASWNPMNNGGFMGKSKENHRKMVVIPSGKRLHNYGKSPFLMGKLTISMAIFNSYVNVYQRVPM